MKISSFCALFLVVLTAFIFTTNASLIPEYGDKATLIPGGRKLKENHVSIGSKYNNGDARRVTLNDYGNDPTPTMKNVNKGPIEHEAPIIPYIPKLPPPPSPGISRGNPVQEIPGNPGNNGDYN